MRPFLSRDGQRYAYAAIRDPADLFLIDRVGW